MPLAPRDLIESLEREAQLLDDQESSEMNQSAIARYKRDDYKLIELYQQQTQELMKIASSGIQYTETDESQMGNDDRTLPLLMPEVTTAALDTSKPTSPMVFLNPPKQVSSPTFRTKNQLAKGKAPEKPYHSKETKKRSFDAIGIDAGVGTNANSLNEPLGGEHIESLKTVEASKDGEGLSQS